MESYFKEIKQKITKIAKVDNVIIINNTHLHTKHKQFQKGKLNLKIEIFSDELKSKNRIDSHRLIMKSLSQDIKDKIHALEIIFK